MIKKRTPQVRGEKTKEKICTVAKRLFSQKGYYMVSTNEIAKEAGISVGTLYHHFRNREEILKQLITLEMTKFNRLFRFSPLQEKAFIDGLTKNRKKWLRELFADLIAGHEKELDFMRELDALTKTEPVVEKMQKEQNQALQRKFADILKKADQNEKIKSPEVTAIVFYRYISALVEQVVFQENPRNEEIIEEGIDSLDVMLGKYFD